MKHRTFLLSILCLSLFCLGQISYAQTTFVYQCKKRVDSNGVLHKDDRTAYFTFSGDSVYESERDGTLKTINHITGTKAQVYKYCKTVDGNRYYYVWGPTWKNGYMTYGFWESMAVIVSSDYSVLNHYSAPMFGLEGSTLVYYRTTEDTVQKDNVPGLIR